MKRFITGSVAFAIFSILSLEVIAQDPDDLDGDGVKNSEDACPQTRGTKMNKGCPGKDEKSLPVPSTNKTLADLNCEFILSGTCDQILMKASEKEIKDYYGNRFRLSYQFYGDSSSVPVFSFYSVGLVSEIYFFPGSGKIGEGINWGGNKSAVFKKLGDPKKEYKSKNVDGDKYEIFEYDDISFQFTKNRLDKITLRNKLSESEAAAVHAQHMAEKAVAEKEANTPEAKARAKAEKEKQIEADFKELLDQLDAKLKEGHRIINSEIKAIAAGGLFKKAVQDRLDKITAAGDSLIMQFGKKYEGMIPAWMTKAIADKWRPGAIGQ